MRDVAALESDGAEDKSGYDFANNAVVAPEFGASLAFDVVPAFMNNFVPGTECVPDHQLGDALHGNRPALDQEVQLSSQGAPLQFVELRCHFIGECGVLA